jgi:hypothetical protein
MAYMIDPIAEAYGTLLMRSHSLGVARHCFSLRCIPCDIGKNPFLGLFHVELFQHLVNVCI